MARESPLHDFGSYVAYLIPGATLLLGLSLYSETLHSLFATAPANVPTIGGFLYLTAASLAAGMTVNALRWAIIDTLHGKTGLPVPALDFSKLGSNVDAFALLINIHYAHYQFHANMFVSTAITYVLYAIHQGSQIPFAVHGTFVILEVIFFATSRDTLRKYFARSQQLLATGKQ